jgi:hypothetical protein
MRLLLLSCCALWALGCGDNVVLGDADPPVGTGGDAGTGGSSSGTGGSTGSSLNETGGTGGSTGGSSNETGGSSSAASGAPSTPAGTGGAAGYAGPSPHPTPEGECWNQILPPIPVPLPVTEPDFEAACARAASADPSEWSPEGEGTARYGDAQANIIGRWKPCPMPPQSEPPLIEFGGNRRYRFYLEQEGSIDPVGSGVFYLLDSGQLELRNPPSTFINGTAFVSFLDEWQAMRLDGWTYARIEASAQNGLDNPPSVFDGLCDMTGVWDTLSIEYGEPFSISFDSFGNFVVRDKGAAECLPTERSGTYDLTPGTFEITTNLGLGLCDWWFGASFGTRFEGACTRLTLAEMSDNCTGGRPIFGGTTVLQRRY